MIEKVEAESGKGKVLAAEAGGPGATVEVVRNAVMGKGKEGAGAKGEKEKEDKAAAETATEVADSAAKVDGE